MIEVGLTVTDTNQCVGSWGVSAVALGSNEDSESHGLSATSTVQLDGLDICRFIYNISGYVITPGGVEGEHSGSFLYHPRFEGIVLILCQ